VRFSAICFAALLWAVGPATGALITLDVEVNGGTGAVEVAVGDRVEVKIYGTVTGNTLYGIDFGLAGYHLNITTSGTVLMPVQGWNPFSNWDPGSGTFLGGWDSQWAVAWGNQALLSILARGNASNPGFENSVMGHGASASTSSIDAFNHSFGSTRVLLSTGEFEAVAVGQTFLGPSGTYNGSVISLDGSNYITPLAAQVLQGGAWVTVVPEPGAVVLAILGVGGLLLRRGREAR
jgi:hypothetical protein